jgi:hypothetical protein
MFKIVDKDLYTKMLNPASFILRAKMLKPPPSNRENVT